MSTKICTSIEQSKKLLSLGIDPSTSDMYHNLSESQIPNVIYGNNDDFKCYLPAWSLTALLKLMPLFIRTDNGDYNFSLARGGAGAYTFSYTNARKEPWESDYDLYLTTHKDSVIDAAFEMVCWLIKQGYIKVNK